VLTVYSKFLFKNVMFFLGLSLSPKYCTVVLERGGYWIPWSALLLLQNIMLFLKLIPCVSNWILVLACKQTCCPYTGNSHYI
jgi:hypothetical protein